jgi:quaternary ammonium compound-resistance protein SugE
MAWVALLVSAVLEAVWATALGASEGFSKPVPTAVFCVTLALSMVGLGYAAKYIAMSTAYAIWTGTGAALTVTWAMLTGGESVTVLKLLFLIGIVACVIGLKLAKSPVAASGTAPASRAAR